MPIMSKRDPGPFRSCSISTSCASVVCFGKNALRSKLSSRRVSNTMMAIDTAVSQSSDRRHADEIEIFTAPGYSA